MDFSIPEFLSDEHSLGVFLLVTVLMGGSAALLAGRAIAATWRHWWHLALYMLVLSLAVRFLHYALFDSKFMTLHYYLVDYVVCLAFGLLAAAPDGNVPFHARWRHFRKLHQACA